MWQEAHVEASKVSSADGEKAYSCGADPLLQAAVGALEGVPKQGATIAESLPEVVGPGGSLRLGRGPGRGAQAVAAAPLGPAPRAAAPLDLLLAQALLVGHHVAAVPAVLRLLCCACCAVLRSTSAMWTGGDQ